MLGDSSPLALATDVLSGDTGPGSSCRRAVPGSTGHTACQPLLLGLETPPTQPHHCQDQKGPSRDRLHLPRQGHPVTQVCLECLQTGSSSHSTGSLLQCSAALHEHTALPKKATSATFQALHPSAWLAEGSATGQDSPPEPRGDPRSCCAATAVTESAPSPAQPRAVTRLSPAPAARGAPSLTSCS